MDFDKPQESVENVINELIFSSENLSDEKRHSLMEEDSEQEESSSDKGLNGDL